MCGYLYVWDRERNNCIKCQKSQRDEHTLCVVLPVNTRHLASPEYQETEIGSISHRTKSCFRVLMYDKSHIPLFYGNGKNTSGEKRMSGLPPYCHRQERNGEEMLDGFTTVDIIAHVRLALP